jgi:co-chaperonin GroES (HSP10)
MPTKTAGGIIIPDTAQEKLQQGKVIAVGPGGRDESGKLIPIDIKVGDRILFGKWSGTGSNRARGSGAICTPTRADGRFNL